MKLIEIIVLIAFLSGYRCETIDDVVNEYRPAITQLQNDLKLSSLDASNQLNLSKATMQSNVLLATSRINQQKLLVQDQINLTPAGNLLAKNCKNQANSEFGPINPQSINDCNYYTQLKALYGQTSLLKKLIGQAKRISTNCSQLSLDPAEVRVCIDDGMESIRQQEVELKGQLVGEINRIGDASMGCVAENENSLSDAIDQVSQDFHNCIDSAGK